MNDFPVTPSLSPALKFEHEDPASLSADYGDFLLEIKTQIRQVDMLSTITREKQLKKWNRTWKLALIEKQNPTWQDLWPTIL